METRQRSYGRPSIGSRWWNEPPTLTNDRRTLARHLIEEHGTVPVATHAAPMRMLLEVHAEAHQRQATT